MKKGRMNTKQKKIQKEISTLIFLIFQEGGLNDNEVHFPEHLKSYEFIYKNTEHESLMVEGQINSIKNIAESAVRIFKNENPEDLQRVYKSLNLTWK